MKAFAVYAVLFALVFSAVARELKSQLHEKSLTVIAEPDFSGPLDESFCISKGRWTPGEGELSVVNLPEEKHIPVLHHNVGLESAVIEVEFFMEKSGSFLVGCDSDKHIGRVVVNASGLSIAEDSVKPSHSIVTLDAGIKPGKWHQLRVEWKGDEMAANLNGEQIRARHPYLATPKKRSWLAAGDGVKVRNLRISGEKSGS